VAWLGVLDSITTTKGGEQNLSPDHNNNNMKNCLLEVPGIMGAFLNLLRHQRTDPEKKTTTVAVVAVRPTVQRIRTVRQEKIMPTV
jgi:hypothetical protein